MTRRCSVMRMPLSTQALSIRFMLSSSLIGPPIEDRTLAPQRAAALALLSFTQRANFLIRAGVSYQPAASIPAGPSMEGGMARNPLRPDLLQKWARRIATRHFR